MAFWRKSEDPWDKRPEKAEKTPPMTCPWCGEPMEMGYLDAAGGGAVWWTLGKPDTKSKLIGADPKCSLRVDDEGVFHTYKTCGYCRRCEKMAFDAAGMCRPYDSDGLPEEPSDKSE